jgi:hypothetical protein
MKTDYLLWPRIKAGHYAIPDASGVLKFYEVATPSKGKWVGWIFLSVQASDDRYPIKGQAERERVFRLIEQNPIEALRRYGQEIGRCGHCGRTLTDETSRKFGIGPVCREALSI